MMPWIDLEMISILLVEPTGSFLARAITPKCIEMFCSLLIGKEFQIFIELSRKFDLLAKDFSANSFFHVSAIVALISFSNIGRS